MRTLEVRRATRRRIRSSLPLIARDEPTLRTLIIGRMNCQGFRFGWARCRCQGPAGGAVGGIEGENFIAGGWGLGRCPQSEMGQALEVPTVRPVAAREIVLEEQH